MVPSPWSTHVRYICILPPRKSFEKIASLGLLTSQQDHFSNSSFINRSEILSTHLFSRSPSCLFLFRFLLFTLHFFLSFFLLRCFFFILSLCFCYLLHHRLQPQILKYPDSSLLTCLFLILGSKFSHLPLRTVALL